MIYAITDARIISARIARKVERSADRTRFLSATGTQAVLRCRGIAVVGSRAWMNGLAETKYPYPSYEIETGQVAIVALVAPKKEYVN